MADTELAYEDMDVWQQMKHDEIVHDARQEEEDAAREAAEEAADAAAAEGERGCEAEFIDGSYTYCGCEECDEREEEDRQHAYERGEVY